MPPRRKAPAAKAKASKAASPPAAGVDKKFALPQQQQQQTEPSTVATLFNRAQEAGTAAAAKRLADLLWSAWARQANDGGETGEGAFWLELERCVSHLLVNATQGANPHAEKCLRFVAAFAGARPRLSSETNDPDSGSSRQSLAADALVERLLSLLAQASAAGDRGVRARSASLLASCLDSQGEDAELSEALAVSLAEAAAARLADRAPPVRAAAVRVLGRLADPGPLGDFSGCPVATAYLRLLRTERHRDVRRAVVACAPLCSRTLPALVERSRDSDDGVRRAVFVVLAEKVPMAALSIGARCALLDRGLRDRAPSVAGAARAMLVRWLDVPAAQGGCDGDVGALLGALDVDGVSASSSAGAGSAAAADSNDNEASSLPSPSSPSPFSREAVAEAALRALDAEGRLHAAPLAHAASETGSGLRRKLGAPAASPAADDAAALASTESGDGRAERGGPGEAAAPAPPMSPEEALLWRVVAAVLSERATARGRAAANSSGAVAAAHAAAASEALSALEAALPDTVEQLCDLVRDAVAAANDAAVVSEAEAARAHRFVARQLVKVVATVADLADEAGRAAAAGLLGFLLADAASATAQLSGGAADDEEEDEADGAASDGEDGAGGDGDAAAREWTDALAALARAATATPCEVCPAALASIALRLPGQLGGCCGGSGAAGDGMDEEDAAAALAPTGDAAAWRGCLGAAAALLRCLLPNSRVGAREVHGPLGSSLETLADLRPALVAPALCHSSPRVRAAAVEAAGLLSLASDDGGEVAALVAALRAAATADEPRVAARAVRALSDATLVRGPRALDALVAEVDEEDAGEEGEGVAGGGEEAPELPATSSAAAAASEASPPGRRKRTKAPEQQQPRRQQPQPILALLSDAVSSLGSEDPCAVAGSEAAAEGLAKILLHRGADDAGREVSDGAAVAALSKLLAVVGEGDALAAPRARQALAVFFPMYAARGSRAAARLGAAALPAARAAAAADGKASSGADVLRYVAGVLGSVTAAQQAQRLRQQQQQQQQERRFGTAAARANANSYNLPRYCPAAALLTSRAAVALFREARRVAPVAVAKPYAAAAVTLACALPMLLPASASALVVSPSPLMPHGQPAAPPPVPAARRVAAAAEAAAGSLPASSGAAKVAQALARRLLSSAAALVAGENNNNNNNAAEKEEDDVAARLAATALGSAAAAPAEAEGAGEASASGNGAAPRAAATSGSALADADGDDEEEEDAFWSSLCEEAGVAAAGAALPFEAELAALGGGVGVGRRSTAAAAVVAADDDEDAAGGATPLRRTRRAAAARATGRLRKVVADDVTSGSSSSESEEEENSSSSSDDEGGGDGNESGGDNVGEGGDVDTRRSRSAATASKIEDSSSEDDEDVGDDENTAPLMTANSSLSPAPSSFSRPLSPSATARSASKGFADCDEGNLEESFGGLSGGLVRFSPAI